MLWTSLTRMMLAAIVPVTLALPAAAKDAAPGIRYDQIPAGAYAVVADIRAKPGKADELRKATLPPVEEVRGEPNNLLYFLHEDRDATPHVQAWFAKLPDLADGNVKVMRMEVLGNKTKP